MWLGGWVVQWVNGWGQVILLNYRINLDLIKIIKFCLKIYDLLRHLTPMGGCMGGWVDGWFSGSMGGVRSND